MNSKEALENYHSMAYYQSVIVDDTSHYEAIKKDLEILDFLIEKLYVASGLFELQVCPPNNPMIKKYHNAIETHDERFDKYYKRICELKYGNK